MKISSAMRKNLILAPLLVTAVCLSFPAFAATDLEMDSNDYIEWDPADGDIGNLTMNGGQLEAASDINIGYINASSATLYLYGSANTTGEIYSDFSYFVLNNTTINGKVYYGGIHSTFEGDNISISRADSGTIFELNYATMNVSNLNVEATGSRATAFYAYSTIHTMGYINGGSLISSGSAGTALEMFNSGLDLKNVNISATASNGVAINIDAPSHLEMTGGAISNSNTSASSMLRTSGGVGTGFVMLTGVDLTNAWNLDAGGVTMDFTLKDITGSLKGEIWGMEFSNLALDNTMWDLTMETTLASLDLSNNSAINFFEEGGAMANILAQNVVLGAGTILTLNTDDKDSLLGTSVQLFQVDGNLQGFNDNVEFQLKDSSGALWTIDGVANADGSLTINGFEFVIPEPATATLGLLGLAGIMLRRRKLSAN